MVMYTYKNIGLYEYIIPGVGVVAPGETIESEIELANPYLELIGNVPEAVAPVAEPVESPIVETPTPEPAPIQVNTEATS